MAASAAADDRFIPIYISSDEDDEVTVLGSSNRAKEIQIKQAILLSMDSSRDPTTIPSSSSASPFPSGTSGAGTSEESIPDRKGNRELPLFPVASSRSLSKQKTRQVIDVDDDSLLRVIDLDGNDDSIIFVKEIGNGSRKKPRRASGSSKCPVALCGTLLKPEVINVDDDGDDSRSTSGKGKQPCNGMLQEFGQCSSFRGAMIIDDFYCTICLEEVLAIECFPVSGCTHAFCVSCVRQYIAAKVEENVLSIGCPDPGCKDGSFHPEECRDVIPLQLFQRWGAALCDMAFGTLKFYCPFSDCSVLLIDDQDAAITDVECPHCSRMFCAQCKVPWHDGVDCAEFQRLGADERGREDLLLRKVAQKSKWQRCPKCKMYVERVEGCVYIVCRCSHRFCYLCGSAMVKGNHHCSKCKRTW